MSGVSIDRGVLDRPAEEGARVVAHALLDQADAALERLQAGVDPEALHDFRVSLRRLRSCLTVYAQFLDLEAVRSALRTMREIAGRTGEARDAEVHIAWLETELRKLDRRQREPLRAWLAELQVLRDRGYERACRDLVRDYAALVGPLRASLSEYRTQLRRDGSIGNSSFARASGEVLGHSVEQLRSALAAIRFPHDDAGAHRARIQGKVVRYVLEPVAAFTTEGRAALGQLKRLQDVLGELNDLRELRRLLRGALERAALRRVGAQLEDAADPDRCASARANENALWVLQRRLMTRRQLLAGQLRDSLSASLERELFEALERVSEQLRSMASDPPLEIERRYLLSRAPDLPEDCEELQLEQGWLPGDAPRERLRRTCAPQGERFERTLKIGSGLTREEWEQEISREVFERLWPLTEQCRIRKTRYRVANEDLHWEIDVYADVDLLVAEIELPTETTAVRFPAWLEPCIEREVTEDPRFTSLSIALHGVPSEARAASSSSERAPGQSPSDLVDDGPPSDPEGPQPSD